MTQQQSYIENYLIINWYIIAMILGMLLSAEKTTVDYSNYIIHIV